jgi:hypothetical protein
MGQHRAIHRKPSLKGEIPIVTIGTFGRVASVAHLIVGTLVFV